MKREGLGKFVCKIFVCLSLLGGTAYAEVKEEAPQKMKNAKMFQSVAMDEATILQDSKNKLYCPLCGMNLPMFYKTNHAALHEGHTKQYCSLHCLVEDKIQNKADLKDIQVVDVTSLKFIDAQSATYVVGSSKKGTMSMVSKYAFAKKADAEVFVKEFGGEMMGFEEAYIRASQGFEKEMMMVSENQATAGQKGEMIYNKMCQKTDILFASTAEAKTFIKEQKLCEKLDEKQLQAVGLYLYKR
jgi:nitrous oxide reductase accessory protein NosL